jgi:N-acetylglucosamine kinase-like BadF-type ATPase
MHRCSQASSKMTRSYFLGIDGGGTKTRAVLIDENRREIARAVSGPSNYHSVGQAAAQASLGQAIGRVLASARRTADDVQAIGLGMAGVARPDDHQTLRSMLAGIAAFPRVAITHDAEAALVGGIGHRYGIVLIAGTGAMAYGVNAQGQSRRADGWGYLLGDDGSAYWIGREGLRAVACACDGRGCPTALQNLVFAELHLDDCSGLVSRVYAAGFDVPHVAAIAPLVEQAAVQGDSVAGEILQKAGQRLGHALCTLVRELEMTDETFEVVLAGGVLRTDGVRPPGGHVRDAVVAALRETAPHASAIAPRHDAAFGAALLAQHTGGGQVCPGEA